MNGGKVPAASQGKTPTIYVLGGVMNFCDNDFTKGLKKFLPEDGPELKKLRLGRLSGIKLAGADRRVWIMLLS